MKTNSYKNTLLSNKLIAISIVSLFFTLTASPLAGSETSFLEGSSPEAHTNNLTSTDDQELDLLRVEHYLYVNASADVGTFHIRFSFPPDYQYQVPLMLEIYNDRTTSDILHYQIENDTNEPNKIINFTIGAMEKDESVLLHFSCWVLVKNHDFSDLPSYVKIPKKYQLPEDTKIWLASTKEVQTTQSSYQT